mmetsp:Transcript_26745/g.74772  ORF Transcript_26745/g.74772 Transcript_26745/m.74772 type:complete len:439 (+) Transcript_26745:64-1380(+)|eukprot:CAMPEP_0119124510 /NCGR_PEP_ID=MMETSP1310-20130426/4116_1 /TAXON_ID=464262 /ORGANISM="Genus nov. species nov., Strain RCC2339" /LENGTH=438 /DNA_ID=CAMNT_0007114473 /DNA_START=44 /DNA_END=1360 /DNA_ORIENTATION=+
MAAAAAKCWENKKRRASNEEEEDCVQLFQEFLRIETVSFTGVESGAYEEASQFLQKHCKSIGLQNVRAIPVVEGKPIVIATWPGSDSSLGAILLNSHYDVVPAVLESWHCEPFKAIRERDTGRIYARGTQDMKCVCMQHLLSIRRLIREGHTPKRTIHLTFVPDEEIGGKDGMKAFTLTKEFKDLNITVALDEGLANVDDAYTVFYGERTAKWLIFQASGPTGHGSRFIQDTAPSKIISVCEKALKYRAEQEKDLNWNGAGCAHAQAKKLGDVTTLNLTMLETGVTTNGGETFSLNVIPTEARAGFDIRITPKTPVKEIEEMLDRWAAEAGENVSWALAPWIAKQKDHYISALEGIWFERLEKALSIACSKKVEPEIFPAATDSRFLRELNIPAFGFSPMANTPILLHEHNEFIDEGVFLEGIDVFTAFLREFASGDD